jgi:hypothetical protein
MPDALVTAVELDNAALAPAGGAPNVTLTPFRGLPSESFTVTCSAFANALPSAALCGDPAEAVRLAGGPTVLVNEKDAESAPTVAVIV